MWEGPALPWPRAQLFFPIPSCRAEGAFLCSQGSGFSPQWSYGFRDIHHPEKLLIWKKKVFTRQLKILSKTTGKLVVTLLVPSADRQFCLRTFQVEKEQAVSRRIRVWLAVSVGTSQKGHSQPDELAQRSPREGEPGPMSGFYSWRTWSLFPGTYWLLCALFSTSIKWKWQLELDIGRRFDAGRD